MTGEASPYYLFHPRAAERMHALIPDARLIVILRDPVARAVSHYYTRLHQRQQPLLMMQTLLAEEDRLKGQWQRLWTDEHGAPHGGAGRGPRVPGSVLRGRATKLDALLVKHRLKG